MLYLSYHFVCMHVYFVFSLFSGLFSFLDFPSVLWYCWLGLLTCKNRLPYNLYCVGGDVKHCTIQSNPFMVQNQLTVSLRLTIAIWLLGSSLLWGGTVGYPSDSWLLVPKPVTNSSFTRKCDKVTLFQVGKDTLIISCDDVNVITIHQCYRRTDRRHTIAIPRYAHMFRTIAHIFIFLLLLVLRFATLPGIAVLDIFVITVAQHYT